MDTARKISPEERLWQEIYDNLSYEKRIEAAQELHKDGEDLDSILRIFPEYKQYLQNLNSH